MSDQPINDLMPEEDLQAALAEIESMSPEEFDSIPDLDDGGGDAEFSDPSPGGEELQAALTELENLSAPDADSSADAAAPKVSKAKPAAGGNKPRFQVGKKATPKTNAATEKKKPEPLPDAGEISAALALALRVADVVLALIDRPFSALSEARRTTIGYIALATIAVSLVAMVILPYTLPTRDAIAYVQQKRAALERGELAIAHPASIVLTDQEAHQTTHNHATQPEQPATANNPAQQPTPHDDPKSSAAPD